MPLDALTAARYNPAKEDEFMFLNILMALALLTVLGTLILGMINLTKTGEEALLKSNKLMRIRIMAQGVAIAVLFIAIWAKKNAGG